jgi:methylenetetrahydrofolate dehydrogenase (NADP+)/methenyltetrahydrofolate cyclohydrolase
MPAQIIDGKAIAAAVRSEIGAQITALVAAGGRAPGLATVIVGDDPASHVYVANKHKACDEVGFVGSHNELPADSSTEEVAAVLERLNSDPAVDGILLQLPVPQHLEGGSLTALISPSKDVDGLTPASAGLLALGRPGLRPCTPSGCIELLDRSGVDIEGAEVVIVGRSDLVGKPIAQLLLQRNATVTIAHSRTRDLAAVCRRADILVAAAGVPELVKGDWVKEGATVIDVGINRTEDGLIGDVEFAAAAERAAWITPVPGGVGPMTIAMLLKNTVIAYGVTP